MTTNDKARAAAWQRDGYFIEPGLIDLDAVARIENEVISVVRSKPPQPRGGQQIYFIGDDYLVHCETAPTAENAIIVDRVAEILGGELDCFQSQFIFKNPGVVGQPWHQDSLYFNFTMQPQVGVWVALTRATLENGCLWVLKGSHREPIHRHVPDRRPEANRGYLEIVDHDFSGREPVTMEAGDVLFFHSFLMHMSTDNVTDYRRSAMVYHYGRAGTEISPEVPTANVKALQSVNRWMPVRRSPANVK